MIRITVFQWNQKHMNYNFNLNTISFITICNSRFFNNQLNTIQFMCYDFNRYLIFKVPIANTTHKMVTIQNLTAILLSWYPSFW